MRHYINILVLIATVAPSFLNSQAVAHGESKAGPHQGYVRMPGAFHTEVVPDGVGGLKIYLLDLSFGSSLTDRSTVDAELLRGGLASVALRCEKAPDSFVCRVPDGANLDSGVLEIKATRQGAVGVAVQYKLPLTYADTGH